MWLTVECSEVFVMTWIDCCTVFVLQIKPFIHYYTTTVYDDGGKEALLGVMLFVNQEYEGLLDYFLNH